MTVARSLQVRARRTKRRLVDAIEPRRADPIIRQLRGLRKAYAGSRGPELLIFGDSAMLWTSTEDSDGRSLATMVRDELGRDLSLHTIVGPCYNPRIVGAFLTALEHAASRPKVVISPASLIMATTSWQMYPHAGLEVESNAVRQLVATKDTSTRRLPKASAEAWEAFDRAPVPSLVGLKHTNGSLRMIMNAVPATGLALPVTKWQHLVRMRHMMDHANSEKLTPQSVGVTLVRDLALQLQALGLPSVAYIPPVNYELIAKLLRPEAVDHIRENAAVVEQAYAEAGDGSGVCVNAAFLSPEAHFGDAIHVKQAGRATLAVAIADAVRPLLP